MLTVATMINLESAQLDDDFISLEKASDIDFQIEPPTRHNLQTGSYLEVPLENINEMQYVARMKLGSRNEERTLLFDTGSNALWLTSEYCEPGKCDNVHSTPYSVDDSTSGKYFQDIKIGRDGSQITYYMQ